jgi:hypothetical protein
MDTNVNKKMVMKMAGLASNNQDRNTPLAAAALMAQAKTQGQGAPLVRSLRLGDYADVEAITPDQCIAHLKILSAIADLRDSVSRMDKLFSIDDRQIGAFGDTARMTKAHALLREKRWEIYVARAVDRFTTWLMTCVNVDAVGPNQGLVTLADIEKGTTYHRLPEWNYRITWDRDLLPPLGRSFLLYSVCLESRC